MADEDAIQEDLAATVEVFLTVDLDGQYWWALRDDDGELQQSDGPYADRGGAEQAATAALTPQPPAPPRVVFTVEEDQRVAEPPS